MVYARFLFHENHACPDLNFRTKVTEPGMSMQRFLILNPPHHSCD